MKVSLKNLEGCMRLLEIRAEEKDVQEAEEKVFQDFERVARIPGFRIGKAPRSLVARHYEKEAREETLKRLLSDLYARALQELRLKPVGFPQISDVHFEHPKLSFKAKVETEPEVPLRKYKGLRATREKVMVTPEEIQKSLQAIREERAELVPKEGVLEEGNFAVCDVEGWIDGKMAENRKNVLLHATAKQHPELTQALLGAHVGDLRETDVTLESPGGVVQKARYKIRIHEIKRRDLPELNDEFVKGISRFQTVQELEEAISKEIQARKELESQKALEKELLSQLRVSCSFEVPRILVEEQAKRFAEEEQFQLKLLGWTHQAIEARLVQNREALFQEAERWVRNSLILEEIAEVEKLQVPSEEVDERIRSRGSRLGRSDQEKEKDLANESLRRRISGEALLEKALAIVVSAAQIQEAP